MLPLETFLDTRCPRDYGVDSVSASTRASLCLVLRTPAGCVIDLTNQPTPVGCADDEESSSSSSAAAETEADAGLPTGWELTYRAKDTAGGGVLFSKTMTAVDPVNGSVRLDLDADDLQRPGIFLSEVALTNADGDRLYSEARYLEVRPVLDDLAHATLGGPITVAEIRLALRDYGCDNTLLDAEEFTDDEIVFAIRRPVQRWNETPPPIGRHTMSSFPYREHWMIGTVGYLHRLAAVHYRRNNLDYSGSGLNVSDKRKYDDYEKIAAMRIGEFDEWMRDMKTHLNVMQGFGTFGSAYGMRYFSR